MKEINHPCCRQYTTYLVDQQRTLWSLIYSPTHALPSFINHRSPEQHVSRHLCTLPGRVEACGLGTTGGTSSAQFANCGELHLQRPARKGEQRLWRPTWWGMPPATTRWSEQWLPVLPRRAVPCLQQSHEVRRTMDGYGCPYVQKIRYSYSF